MNKAAIPLAPNQRSRQEDRFVSIAKVLIMNADGDSVMDILRDQFDGYGAATDAPTSGLVK
jgi:hypothetical protein